MAFWLNILLNPALTAYNKQFLSPLKIFSRISLLAITEIRIQQTKIASPLKSVKTGVNCNPIAVSHYMKIYLACRIRV